jgi:peptidoglycan/xylan/chitin deacetylase (PgdA/CDA1 family)
MPTVGGLLRLLLELTFSVVCFVVYYSGLLRVIRYISRRHATIVMYHSVTPTGNPYIYPDNIVSPDNFKKQLDYIKRNYTVISLDTMVRIVRGGKTPLPYSIALTFDDGYNDFLENALPILNEHGLPATVFPITGLLDSGEAKWEDQLTSLIKEYDGKPVSLNLPGRSGAFKLSARGDWRQSARRLNQLLCKASPEEREQTLGRLRARSTVTRPRIMMLARELTQLRCDHRITIGCHTHTHASLGGLDTSWVKHEACESKRIIENITGRECTLFSYPFGKRGDFNQDTKKTLRDLGFAAALTTLRGCVTKDSDPYELRRIAAVDDSSYLFRCSLVGLTLQS